MQLATRVHNKITKDTLILFMVLFYPAVHNYIWRITAVAGIVGLYISIEVFDAIAWTVVIGAIIITTRKPTINTRTLFVSLVFVIVTLLCFVLTNYDYFTGSVLFSILIGTFSFFLQGSYIDIKRVSHRQLYIAAIITLVVSILYSTYSIDYKGMTLDDNMDFAYKVLPSVLVIYSWLFTQQKKKVAIVFSVIGTIFLLLQGTRGPLFCLAFFICLMIYKKHGLGMAFVRVGVIVMVALLLFNLPIVQLKLVELTDSIDSSGYSSRFIRMTLDGDLSDANGRDAIKETLIEEIKENPIKIRGMFADRQATQGLVDREYSMGYENGTYAHSLWIEIIYQWGVILGGALLMVLFWLVFKIVIKSEKSDSYIIILFVCTGFVPLFMSGSYLRSAELFFLLGIATIYQPNTVKGKRDVLV